MNFSMPQAIQRIVAIAAVLLLSACATPTKMAYESGEPVPDLTKKQVLLMTATIKNNYKPKWQPGVHFVSIERAEVKGAEDRLNFVLDQAAKSETAAGNDYLVRMELENGKYVLRSMTGFSRSFPIMGTFTAPLHFKIDSQDKGLLYIGHIDAFVRERVGEEFRAGLVIPLIDQAVTGFANGTWDITISDRYDADVAAFRKKFPALANIEVKKSILPAFDRKVAQEWWEKN
jgi:hypothetical protein